jgi:elongation factor G
VIVKSYTFLDGSFHPVDSECLIFELAARMGYRAKAAGAVILEPIMKMEVTPEENMGDIVGDINRRRGQVNDIDDKSRLKLLKRMCHYLKCLDMLQL